VKAEQAQTKLKQARQMKRRGKRITTMIMMSTNNIEDMVRKLMKKYILNF
jgi:hypothetical protein